MVVLKHEMPSFTAEDADRIAGDLYGVPAPDGARALPGEHDQNFSLRTAAGEEYVLKIAHAAEERAVLDLQNAALAHLAARAPSLALPRVRPTLTGEPIGSVAGHDGADHLVRLLTYVPGKLFATTRPHSPAMLHSLGRLLATLDQALLDFSHPAAERELKWDLARSSWIRDYLPHVAAPARRALVERFLAPFEAEALPMLPSLRASVIYHDANDHNVLVGPPDAAGQQRVTGVVDFGDMLRTATVCEPAIACAYAMLGKPDPLAAAAHVGAGYHATLPLTEAELAVLYPLICARLCVSVVNSAYQRAIDPGNTYLQVSDGPAWDLLERLADVPPSLAHYCFRQACGLVACPTTPAIVRWLREHREEIGRVVEPDLNVPATSVAFDLSIGSIDLGSAADGADMEALTAHLFEQMRTAQASVGIGRYDEARAIYTSDAYRIAGNDGSEWRTVHLGLDLTLEAGAPVYAPLDGVVHSFQNNAAPRDYGPTIVLQHTVAASEGGGEPLTFYTIYGHLSLDSLDSLQVGMPVARGSQIARIGDPTVNGGWWPHLHFQIIADLLGKQGDFPGVGRPSQRALWLSISPDPNLILGIPPEWLAVGEELSAEQILATRRHHLGPNLSVAYSRPLTIVRGRGQYVYDADGRAYLDAVNNVAHVGHSHPRVVAAGQRQMAVLNTNTRYLHTGLVRYAERLCATLPPPLRVCYFVCSGSEANELALRLARTYTRRRDVIVVDAAYHGNTTALVEISPYKAEGPGGAGLAPYAHEVPMPDVYRGAYRRDDPQAGAKYAEAAATAVEEARQAGDGIAAFICESALGCGGQIVLPEGYLAAAYAHVRAAGGVCIADEVQTGFGRAGSAFWMYATQGVVPDIVTLGKPIGNGHPLGAVVTTPEIAAAFDNGMEYFNTFGGNPVSCAIGLAVLDVIADERLQANALAVGAHLLEGLRGLMDRHPLIGDVRGLGLFIGVELVRDRASLTPAAAQASYVANRMRERGVLLSTDGPLHNVLKIKPPLAFDAANADELVATLDAVLDEDPAQP
jgi:4-aminobutyrate aminotransferase-like enzyme/Ser/Thr protein kinase RdoA (MazF antagonist)